MADPVLLDNLAIYAGGYDIAGQCNECHFVINNAENADARFSDVLDAKYPGVLSPSVDLAGFYSAADTGQPDPVFFPRIGGTSPDVSSWPLTLAPPYAPSATPGADGNICYSLLGAQFGYETFGAFGQSMPFKLKTLPRSATGTNTSGVVVRQTVIMPKATRSATTTGTGRQLGAVAATQEIVGVIHFFTVTGGSWVVTIESDDNSGFTTPTVRMTFTAITAIGRQAIRLSGAVTDDWWRAVVTKTGGTSCSAAVALGIKPLTS